MNITDVEEIMMLVDNYVSDMREWGKDGQFWRERLLEKLHHLRDDKDHDHLELFKDEDQEC